MPVSPFHRRDVDKDAVAIALAASDMSLADHSPFLSYDDSNHYESSPLHDDSHMIFDFDDMNGADAKPPMSPWDAPSSDYHFPPSIPSYLASPESTSSQLEYGSPQRLHTADHSFDSGIVHYPPPTPEFSESSLYSNWLNDADVPQQSTSAPINIPSSSSGPYDFAAAYSDKSSVFPDVSPFSPTTAYAALQPLPPSPAGPGDAIMTDILRNQHGDMDMAMSLSPSDPSHLSAGPPPPWAAQLWSSSPAPSLPPAVSPQHSSVPFPDVSDEDPYATQRPRTHHRRDLSAVWSSSAPSPSPLSSHGGRPQFTRAYSRRAESISGHVGDQDATLRVTKRRSPPTEDDVDSGSSTRLPSEQRDKSPPLKSTLKPPKLAPSAWQLYFTDWIQQHQATSSKKLNVAQAAKEAGLEYARLTPEEKEPYKKRSLQAKDLRERELAAYMRTLTPDDIKRENLFRTAQRKAGKSRKGNIKDPNAPKKPLSAYFMFLQRIRSDRGLVREVFGEETETTKQSVLAAARWRGMTDEERKPFLAQAEQEKLEYESARKLYEEGTPGFTSSINFSILPGSPINAIAFPSSARVKQEPASSESESEDGGVGRVRRA
ncbi:exp1-like protein [Steccherinum ochraceum]|uniref:Exp1-like protein n=1 Tax=Steccherinum ochraceum TaxID=92696 RepID=A0A4R0RUW3_9APHY|nr:exp1-like protein [Steccherinum ochraceum]